MAVPVTPAATASTTLGAPVAARDGRPPLIRRSPADARSTTRIGRFLEWLETSRGLDLPDWTTAWQWSIDRVDDFWAAIAEYFDVTFHSPPSTVLNGVGPADARWFPGATINYAEQCLRACRTDPGAPAIEAFSEVGEPDRWDGGRLLESVRRCRAGLAGLGVTRGDRVASYLPNAPEAVVVLLATASLGAIYTSCAPEFGVKSVTDRLGQVRPKVLVAASGYTYGGKWHGRTDAIGEICRALPTLETLVLIGDEMAEVSMNRITWRRLLEEDGPLAFDPVPFDHPLWILYSSGTTGLPKPIVHSHGGITMEHLKTLGLHDDLGPGDRFFWHTTTGWMMWNYSVSVLLHGAAAIVYDGSPTWPATDQLWSIAQRSGATHFGASPTYFGRCSDEGLHPRHRFGLPNLKQVSSAGSPLSAAGHAWISEAVGQDIRVLSMSGGTDVCSAFLHGNPLLDTYAGEMTSPTLGSAVFAFDPEGRPVMDEPGELVITRPMPSMPISFWENDREAVRRAYFSGYPGVWTHGDRLIVRSGGGYTITGRSDATLNRGGVRLGTADFYSVLDTVPEIEDSLVVFLEDPDDWGPGSLVLFLVMRQGALLTNEFEQVINRLLRDRLSPRHQPDRIRQIGEVPYTLTGKKTEIPVKRVLLGAEPSTAVSFGAMRNPAALEQFIAFRNVAGTAHGAPETTEFP